MSRLIWIVVIVAALAVGGGMLAGRATPRADFVFINRGDVGTLDLQRMSWMQDLRVARLLFEGLVRTDIFSPGYAVQPGMAERWEVSPDLREYTFYLRADAKWSNGEPVLASDFVYSWRRALMPEIASDYFKLFQLIDGADAFFAWRKKAQEAYAARPSEERTAEAAQRLWDETRARFDETVGVKAVDARTLHVRLKRPTPYFLDLCSFAPLFPVNPGLVSRYEQPDASTGRLKLEPGWTKPDVLVSNGAFMLTRWRFKRDMWMEKNPHYWAKDTIDVDTVMIPSIEEPNAAVLAYESGAVDWVSDVTAAYRGDMYSAKLAFYGEHKAEYEALKAQGLDPIEIDRRLPADPRNHLQVFPAFGTYFYNFNCLPTLPDGRVNPMAEPKVRRALAMAIDRRRIAEDIRRIGEPMATTIIPPRSIAGYESPGGLEFSPEKARAMLAEAGYPGGKGLPAIEILFNRDAGHDLIAQAVAKDWQQHLGVTIRMAQREVAVFREDLKNKNYMVSRAGWFGDYGDPLTFLELNRTGDGNNDRAYSNPRYDALLDASYTETDPVKRMEILEEAERIIVEQDLPLVPIFHYSQVYLFDPHKLTGISSHPRQVQNLYEVDILGDGKGSDEVKMLPPRVDSKESRGVR